MLASTTSFSSLAAGYSAGVASAGVWAAGAARFCGQPTQVRYAGLRVGAGVDAQTVGSRGKFTRAVQHSTQPDSYGAARLRCRLVQR